MNGQRIILCPQCGENKVKSNAPAIFQFLLILGGLMCLTIVGIPFGIIFIIGAFIAKKSKARLKFTCQACKHPFNVTESTYNEYNHFLKG